ncbi:MAG: hypothetical protein OQL28_09790 [Sedimenticola sp.]|nr:hypothetical protein [Sedimenticola sp.]
MNMKDFGESASKLARNPLGIIALFIVLVYGIAGIVLSTSSEFLSEGQREIFVWFLVLFPVVVFIGFLWLVSKHHTKLYAPTDYQTEEGFFRSLTPEEKKEKIRKEAEAFAEESAQEPETEAGRKKEKKDPLRNESINERILLAEELVLREVQYEYGSSITRDASLGNDLGLDGLFSKDGKGYGVEVKLVRDRINKPALKSEIKKYSQFTSKRNFRNFNFVLAFAVEDVFRFDEAGVREFVKNVSNSAEINVEVKVYSLPELRDKYGI